MTVPLQMLLGLVLAIILNNKLLKLSTLFRAMIFLPVVSPVAVIGIIWVLLLSPFNGPINGYLLDGASDPARHRFPGLPQLVLWSLAGIFVWKWTGITHDLLAGRAADRSRRALRGGASSTG